MTFVNASFYNNRIPLCTKEMTKRIKKERCLAIEGILGPILLKKKKITASLQKPAQGWENNEKRISAGHFLIELGP